MVVAALPDSKRGEEAGAARGIGGGGAGGGGGDGRGGVEIGEAGEDLAGVAGVEDEERVEGVLQRGDDARRGGEEVLHEKAAGRHSAGGYCGVGGGGDERAGVAGARVLDDDVVAGRDGQAGGGDRVKPAAAVGDGDVERGGTAHVEVGESQADHLRIEVHDIDVRVGELLLDEGGYRSSPHAEDEDAPRRRGGKDQDRRGHVAQNGDRENVGIAENGRCLPHVMDRAEFEGAHTGKVIYQDGLAGH